MFLVVTSLLFLPALAYKYFLLIKTGQAGYIALDAFHFGFTLIAAQAVWALTDKGRKARMRFAFPLVFILAWGAWVMWQRFHPGPTSNLSAVILGWIFPLWLVLPIKTLGAFLPVGLPLIGLLYWSWLGEWYRALFLDCWARRKEGKPGLGRVYYYRLASFVAFFTFLAAAVVHLLLWRLPFLPKVPLSLLSMAGIALFMGIWVVGFIKQEKDKGVWKKVQFKDSPWVRRFTWTLNAYCIVMFLLMFLFGGNNPLIGGSKPRPAHVTLMSPEAEGDPAAFIFMRGWVAFMVMLSFHFAKEATYQVDYLEGKKDHVVPSEEEEGKGVPEESGSHPVQTLRGEVTARVTGEMRLKAPLALLPGVMPIVMMVILGTILKPKLGNLGLEVLVTGAVLLALALVGPTFFYVYSGLPAAILSPKGLWMIELGWMRWDEIAELRVRKVRGSRNVGIIPRDWGWVDRVPWHFRFQARMNKALFGSLTSFPWTDYSVTGEEFLRYARENFGVKVVGGARDPGAIGVDPEEPAGGDEAQGKG